MRTLGRIRIVFLSGLVLLIIIVSIYLFDLWTDAKEIRHVVLISIDTCRADYLSCYGYPSPTTPHIDALAAEGFLFEEVISPAPLTLPAHSTIMTGTIPLVHGVHDNNDYVLN
ncbi:MAG: sulfatase-like hydrolase/transferase, partial [Sedimentisphaerales bacterium]|nr:sulfatase-like hydrolase/transferase [Sedimentisphaerales bacterium]